MARTPMARTPEGGLRPATRRGLAVAPALVRAAGPGRWPVSGERSLCRRSPLLQ